MKKLLFLLTLLGIEKALHAQRNPFVYTINADSVKITNNCDTAELILENHTQNVPGFLYNKGKGRTEFRRPEKPDDSTLILGTDTMVFRSPVPDWQSVLDVGSNLTHSNLITVDPHYSFKIKTGGGDIDLKNNGTGSVSEVYLNSMVASLSLFETDNNGIWGEMSIKMDPSETGCILVRDDMMKRGLRYFTDYSPVGLADELWIPSLKAVRKTVSDSISASGYRVKRVPVNNTTYNASINDNLIAFTALTAPHLVYLPQASQMTSQVMTVKDETGSAATYNITVVVVFGGTIDGATSKVINTNYGSLTVYSNGTQWFTK